MRHTVHVIAAALLFASSAFGDERALLYPTVVETGVNLVGDGKWIYPSGDPPKFTAEETSGGPFDTTAPAWKLCLSTPGGAYWRHPVKVAKGHTYLMGAWLQIDNTTIAIRGSARNPANGRVLEDRVYLYGGFNKFLKPYFSERMQTKIIGDPKAWKLCYRLVSYPDGTVGDNVSMSVGIYLATGGITFANPFFIDVTGLADRSLTVDVAETHPFKRLDVVATGIGDVVWSQDFPQTATTFKGVVPASAADFTRGLTDTLIEGHTLVITYADGTVKSVHAPQEKTRTKRE